MPAMVSFPATNLRAASARLGQEQQAAKGCFLASPSQQCGSEPTALGWRLILQLEDRRARERVCRHRSCTARPTCPAMTLPNVTTPAADESTSLQQALKQSHEAKEKVEDVAKELGSANRTLRRRIAIGAPMVPAHVTLQKGLNVEAKAHDAADDLEGVTDALARGVDELHQVEVTLARARKDLAATESALAAARGEERAATHRAFHDAATGLPNRSLFDDRVAHGISIAERHSWTLAVMFLDLDGFKRVNDTHGHAAGDAVLKAIAIRLSQSARDEDTVCRNGGDEFLYLLVDPKGRENLERIARAMLLRIARPIDAEGQSLVVGSSIGIAVYPGDGQTVEQLVRNADAALYQAKRQGCGHSFFGDV